MQYEGSQADNGLFSPTLRDVDVVNIFTMNPELSPLTLARWMAGEYENQDQAKESPIWFVNLRLWYRPLPQRLAGNLALFAEQANILQLDRPYRQRIAMIQVDGDDLKLQYLAFRDPSQFVGAGANPDRLRSITMDTLETLPGCRLGVTLMGDRLKAELEPGLNCCFQYEGKTRQVVLGLEVSGDRLWSYDRGIDPDTGRSLWGAMMGPYEFRKCADFSSELPE